MRLITSCLLLAAALPAMAQIYQYTDANGNWSPGYEFIDSRTVKAHPFIIEVLLEDAERLWSIDDVLGALED